MSNSNSKLTPKKKFGLSLQLIGIALLVINIYYASKTGQSNTLVIPIGLAMVIGGMLMVIRKEK